MHFHSVSPSFSSYVFLFEFFFFSFTCIPLSCLAVCVSLLHVNFFSLLFITTPLPLWNVSYLDLKGDATENMHIICYFLVHNYMHTHIHVCAHIPTPAPADYLFTLPIQYHINTICTHLLNMSRSMLTDSETVIHMDHQYTHVFSFLFIHKTLKPYTYTYQFSFLFFCSFPSCSTTLQICPWSPTHTLQQSREGHQYGYASFSYIN